jgi:hypothetical protein
MVEREEKRSGTGMRGAGHLGTIWHSSLQTQTLTAEGTDLYI